MSQYKNIKGGAELQAMLSSLPIKIEKNIMRSALRAGAKVIADEAKRNVPVGSGDLRDSIKVSTRVRRGQVVATAKAGDKKAWYWRFVEFGTSAHVIKAKKGESLFFKGNHIKSVDHPGAKAKPFMRPALDNKANAAIQAVGDQVRKRLTKQGLNAPPVEVDDER